MLYLIEQALSCYQVNVLWVNSQLNVLKQWLKYLKKLNQILTTGIDLKKELIQLHQMIWKLILHTQYVNQLEQ